MLSQLLLVAEQSYNTSLVINIGTLANKWVLHLVNLLLKVLLVFACEKLFDVLKTAFTLRDRVYLNALDENLDQGCRLREFSPSQRHTVQ